MTGILRSYRTLALIVVALAVAAFAPVIEAQTPQGRKEPRLALVIGNGAYQASPLTNPVNDARAMADALKATGFTVIRRENASLKDMTLALREFGDRLKHGGVGLFYYAGHGMAVKGRNFLIPVDAQIEREDEIAFNALDADAVLDKMESAGNRLNLVILDACRNNPFARSFRSGSRGLAQMDAPVGTLISFATAPGQVASDGNGKNGLYTQHLLENIKRPGLKIEDLFKTVRVNVRKDSGGKQTPWETSSLEGDFYFVPAPAAAAKAPAMAAQQATATAPAGAPPEEKNRTAAVAFPAGTPVIRIGDSWTYRHVDVKTNKTRGLARLVDPFLDFIPNGHDELSLVVCAMSAAGHPTNQSSISCRGHRRNADGNDKTPTGAGVLQKPQTVRRTQATADSSSMTSTYSTGTTLTL